MNCSIMMYNDRPSFTIMPGFICESAVARWHNQHESFLHQWMWRAQPPELAGLSSTWRTASSRSFYWCADRRRRLRAAGVSGVDSWAMPLLRAAWPSGRARDLSTSQLACT